MKMTVKQNADIARKEAQDVSAMFGKDHAMLDLIRETQRKCGGGARMLPVVRYERKLWFFDERLRQLRTVRNPHDFINLDDFEVEYFRRKVV